MEFRFFYSNSFFGQWMSEVGRRRVKYGLQWFSDIVGKVGGFEYDFSVFIVCWVGEGRGLGVFSFTRIFGQDEDLVESVGRVGSGGRSVD